MIDVVIPVYKPTEYLLSLLYWLSKQTMPVNKVIIINTEKKYFDEFFGEFDVCNKYPFVEIHHISAKEFDHGRTRDQGIKYSDAEFVLLMTDDAVPSDEHLVENLYKAFDNPKVGMSYARQLPHKGCHVIEKYTRSFNYPDVSGIKSADDIDTLGIKAFFASDVCCMYRRSIYDELGGFIDHTIFNEDMIFARGLLNANYLIAYRADAKVYHSHNYTGIQYLKRNFDLGVSQKDHPEVFSDVKSEGEGIKLVKSTMVYLCRHLMPHLCIKLVYHSGCKYIGYYFGRRYDKLPRKLVMKLTNTPGYFEGET